MKSVGVNGKRNASQDGESIQRSDETAVVNAERPRVFKPQLLPSSPTFLEYPISSHMPFLYVYIQHLDFASTPCFIYKNSFYPLLVDLNVAATRFSTLSC